MFSPALQCLREFGATNAGSPSPRWFERQDSAFSRLGLQNIEVTEARVTEIEGRRPSLSIVRLDIRAASPPAFCLGELLVLESLDGMRQWEANMTSDDQWAAYGRSDLDAKFYDSGNWNCSISVHVRTVEGEVFFHCVESWLFTW